MTLFKSQIDKVISDQTTGEFSVITPYFNVVLIELCTNNIYIYIYIIK